MEIDNLTVNFFCGRKQANYSIISAISAPVKILYIWVVAIVMVIAFGGAYRFPGFCGNQHIRDPTWSQNHPFLNRLGNHVPFHVPFMSAFICMHFLHVPFICMHFAFLSFCIHFLSCSFHCPFMFLSFSFQCAFMSFHLPFICMHFPFILHSFPFISF